MYVNRDKFNFLPPAELEERYWQELVSLGTVKTIKAGAMLFEQSHGVSELVCIVDGSAKLLHFFDDGNEKLYGQFIAPAIIGCEALWSRDAEMFFPTITALSDITVSFVPIAAAEELAEQHPNMMRAIFQCVRNDLCISRIRSVCAMPMSLLQKAAFAIVFLYNADTDDEGYVNVTHEELAQLIGISRANVTMALAELSEKNIISKKRGKIKLLDNSGLMTLLNGPF